MAKAKDTAKMLKERSAKIEAQTRDMAQKIWFAGLGAYGRAYTEAATNAKKMNAGTTELFEDLVKRGSEIDGEMKSRFTSNETVSKVTQNVTKMTEAAMNVQREQREALEARMQRMRAVLGFGEKSEKADDLTSKIEQLEDEIAELASQARPIKGKTKVNKDVATRLAVLSAEIDAIAKVNAPAKPKAKPAARRTTAKKTLATKPAAKKAAPKKATAPRKRATKAKA
jgi:poly(hydroxyalkanoate) granule-associated protein